MLNLQLLLEVNWHLLTTFFWESKNLTNLPLCGAEGDVDLCWHMLLQADFAMVDIFKSLVVLVILRVLGELILDGTDTSLYTAWWQMWACVECPLPRLYRQSSVVGPECTPSSVLLLQASHWLMGGRSNDLGMQVSNFHCAVDDNCWHVIMCTLVWVECICDLCVNLCVLQSNK